MIRTLISLDDADKRWLDSYSRRHGQSLAETVRQALRQFRERDPEGEKASLLERTSGLWRDASRNADAYIDRLRDEW